MILQPDESRMSAAERESKLRYFIEKGNADLIKNSMLTMGNLNLNQTNKSYLMKKLKENSINVNNIKANTPITIEQLYPLQIIEKKYCSLIHQKYYITSKSK